MHIGNLFVIIKNREFHNVRYYIIINLSISDLLMVVTRPLTLMLPYLNNEYFHSLSFVFYYSSILSTVLISVDRYIAIKHCLRYREIVTNKKLVISIIASWLTSIVLNLIFLVLPKVFSKHTARYFKISEEVAKYSLMFGSCIILVSVSVQMLYIRRKHVKALMKVESRFGVEKERLDILHNLKQSIEDIFRLNVVTAIIIVVSNITEIFHTYTMLKGLPVVSIMFRVVYLVSNPFIYSLTMSKLRTYYFNCFRRIICK